MGYEVKVADIRDVRKATNKQIEAWLGKLQLIGVACNAMAESSGMQGATAESIKTYVKEVHLSLLGGVAQMIEEYKDRLYVYEVGYESIDGDVKAHFSQDTLEDQNSTIAREEEEFLDLVDELEDALDTITDILSLSTPSMGRITHSFGSLKRKTKVLNDKVGTYEEGHRNDCSGVTEQISSIRAMIVSLNKSSEITISTYRAGAILENPAFLTLK
ncbi:MAG: T7SS effector LXG polymorphic toxin, partial [Lachnotalea sp.]